MQSTVANKRRGRSSALAHARDPFVSMRDEMNDLVSRFWYGKPETDDTLALNPAMDVSEDENVYEVRVDAPGMKTDDFEIEVQGNYVVVSGQRSEETEETNKKFHRVERRTGTFSRGISLPCEINEDEVAAQYDKGVLTVTLPKSEKSRVRKINVK